MKLGLVCICSLAVSYAMVATTQQQSAAVLSSGSLMMQREQNLAHEAFHDFMEEHGREYAHGSSEYYTRRALFNQRLDEVKAHNAKPGQSWQAGLSYFSDRTEEERQAVLGYRRHMSRTPAERSASSFLQLSTSPHHRIKLPEEKNWTHLKVASNVRSQGFCGSCWAFATLSVVEAHYEIHVASKTGESARNFSPQQIVACTPDPKGCGGSGGCGGATVELGMDWIKNNGLASENEFPYGQGDGKCHLGKQDGSGLGGTKKQPLLLEESPSGKNGGSLIGMLEYATLPSNQDYPLAEALTKYGPVGVAVAAGAWFEYKGGVFDGCSKDGVLDHAVTAYGFGHDKGNKYWLIRNSYGPSWGEHGFIRMKRHGEDSKEQNCGTDHDPITGVACKGGPSSVDICGMCGVLYDSVVPFFKGAPEPWPYGKGTTLPEQSGIAGKSKATSAVDKPEVETAKALFRAKPWK